MTDPRNKEGEYYDVIEEPSEQYGVKMTTHESFIKGRDEAANDGGWTYENWGNYQREAFIAGYNACLTSSLVKELVTAIKKLDDMSGNDCYCDQKIDIAGVKNAKCLACVTSEAIECYNETIREIEK